MTTKSLRGNALQRPDDHGALAVMAVAGLVALGIVHLLVGWLGLQLAWGGSSESADQSGALQLLAQQSYGQILLWVLAIGLAMLALWQLAAAIWGHTREQGKKRTFKRVSSAGKAIAYGALSVSAAKFAVGSGSSSSKSQESFTAKLMDAPAGQILVGAVGLAIIAIGGYLIYKGATKEFAENLDQQTTSGGSGDAVIRLGQIGYVAKGLAFAIVGILVISAAVTHDAKKSGGLDEALKTLRDQPYGQWLLTVVALGIAAYGLYCFAWAASERRRAS